MAGADAEGRCGGRRAAVGLLALALVGGCSAATTQDDAPPAMASLDVPPPPAPSAPIAPAVRAAQTATRIEKVSVESAPPTTRVVLVLDGTVEPEVSLLESRRLVIDVPGTTCAGVPRVVEAASDAVVERVRTGQHGPPENKSRVVIDLRQRVDFSVRAQGVRIVAWLSPADAAGAPPAAGGSRILFGAESGATPTDAADAAADAAAPLPPPAEPAALAPQAPAAAMPAPEPPPSPVVEPAAAVPSPSPIPPAIEATATPSPEPSPAAPPELLVEATAAPSPEPPPADAPRATPEAPRASASEPSPASSSAAEPSLVAATPAAASKRISIDFTEADVRTVIELIASAGGYQVLFTPEVGGTVTISLVDRPWEDALATVLRAKRLRQVRHEDVILISPAGR